MAAAIPCGAKAEDLTTHGVSPYRGAPALLLPCLPRPPRAPQPLHELRRWLFVARRRSVLLERQLIPEVPSRVNTANAFEVSSSGRNVIVSAIDKSVLQIVRRWPWRLSRGEYGGLPVTTASSSVPLEKSPCPPVTVPLPCIETDAPLRIGMNTAKRIWRVINRGKPGGIR